jgi:prepilin-type N-terminal cleavage/methylation domain-containing protein
LFYKTFAQAKAYFVYGGSIMTAINKKAFTLIELLVVVLIIGILAAIALPQYRIATLKSKYMQAEITLRALHDANEVYYLYHNQYANSLADLDTAVTSGNGYNGHLAYGVTRTASGGYVGVYDYTQGVNFYWYSINQTINHDMTNRKECRVSTQTFTSWRAAVCQQLTGDASPIVNAANYIYLYHH